jgi:hypothetical protein
MNGMWPTLGEMQEYLLRLGFAISHNRPGFIVCKHPEDGSWFVFRERDRDSLANEGELLDLKVQLPGRGFVSDVEFSRFWNQGMQPAPRNPNTKQ